jgi:hypothetical protein
VREHFSGEFTNAIPRIEDGLLAFIYWVRQVSVITL